jgi:hypothetical protein
VEILCIVARPSDVHTPSRDAGRDPVPTDSPIEDHISASSAPMER